MAPSCKFKSPVWEHFDFLVTILLLFYVCRWKKYTNLHYEYMFWMWNTKSIKLLEPNRNNRKPTSKIKTEPNRKKSEPWQPYWLPKLMINWLLMSFEFLRMSCSSSSDFVLCLRHCWDGGLQRENPNAWLSECHREHD